MEQVRVMAAMKTLIRKLGKTSVSQARCYVFHIRRYSTEKANDDKNKEPERNIHDQDEYEENIHQKILNASLSFVSEHGWSKTAISEGAQSLGYPGITHGMFPNSGADLISYFNVNCNKELTQYMEKRIKDKSKEVEPKVFVQEAVEERLKMIVPYIERWPEALGIMTLPPNVPVALANLLTLVDDICHYAGDNSVNFSWYSRRLAVGGIYKMTELYMIQDKSKDYEETWKFLERRLDEAVQIQQVLAGSGEVTGVAQDAILATFTTARNILRLNRPR